MVKNAILTLLTAALLLATAWVAYAPFHYAAPKEGAPALLLSNQIGDNLARSFCKAIGRARESVFLSIYSLRDPRILAALRERADLGVAVKVIADQVASKEAASRLGPKIETLLEKRAGRMHLKLLVIDNREVWIGSANMTPQSLGQFGNLVATFKSPEVGSWITSLQRGHRSFSVGGQPLELSILPEDLEGASRVKELIETAKKTIRIAMFTWTRSDFATAAIEAAKRGVRVEVALDRNAARGVGKAVVQQLRNGGAAVRLSRGKALLHHKLLYIDSDTLLFGSANWTGAAFTQNSDCFTILRPLTPKQRKKMDALWNTIWQEAS